MPEDIKQKVLEGNELLSKCWFKLLFNPGNKFVTVHLFNPFLDTQLVRVFLSRYCHEVSLRDKLNNNFGIYRSKLKFKVRFKKDPEGYGEIKHPPALFTIAGNRCSLFYVGQPKFCHQCYKYGHTKDECEVGVCCRSCGQPGDQAASCSKPAACDLCGSTTHEARACNLNMVGRMVSYADVARGSRFAAAVAMQNVSLQPSTEGQDRGVGGVKGAAVSGRGVPEVERRKDPAPGEEEGVNWGVQGNGGGEEVGREVHLVQELSRFWQ